VERAGIVIEKYVVRFAEASTARTAIASVPHVTEAVSKVAEVIKK
jgi:hypothetical protein